MPLYLQTAVPSLVGSLLSCLATFTVLVLYIVFRQWQRSFRHALILNLSLAEFINSLNNSISGIIRIANHGVLTASSGCTLNGWLGQWSVQAVDFSILAIAVITLLTVTRKTYMPNASTMKRFLICTSTWMIPTITASSAAGMSKLGPVSGNWCWIDAEPKYLRYALAHGWRFAIIFVTACLYIYIWVFIKQHYSDLQFFTSPFAAPSETSNNTINTHQDRHPSSHWPYKMHSESVTELRRAESETEMQSIEVESHFDIRRDPIDKSLFSEHTQDIEVHTEQDSKEQWKAQPGGSWTKSSIPNTTVVICEPQSDAGKPNPTRQSMAPSRVEREIQRTLLLNSYPLLYAILWIPGILNRIFELTGHPNQTLAILQSSTQFVGFANAVTYGYNEHLRRDLTRRLFKRGNGTA